VYVVGVIGCLYVLMNIMGCFEFWSFYVDIDVMWVYVVSADGHVSSYLSGLSFLVFCGVLAGHILICYLLLVSY
jgi:hypothetical protein